MGSCKLKCPQIHVMNQCFASMGSNVFVIIIILRGFNLMINYESKCENNGRRRSWGVLHGLQHFGGRRAC
jgi:hypothetical protein